MEDEHVQYPEAARTVGMPGSKEELETLMSKSRAREMDNTAMVYENIEHMAEATRD